MAFICFEGFNRTPRGDLWTMVPNGAGGDTPTNSASGRNSTTALRLSMSNAGAGVTLPRASLTIPTQSSDFLYMGFASNGWTSLRQTHERSGTPASATNTNANKYVTFYTSNGAELFSLFLDNAEVSDNSKLGLAIRRGGTLLGRFLVTSATNTAVATFQGEHTGYNSGGYSGGFFFSAWATLFNWNYLELRISLNAVNSTVELRRNGMQLYLSDGGQAVGLGAYNSLRTIDFWSPPYNIDGWSLEDFYIVNSTPPANDYLGPETHIHSPTFASGQETTQEWVDGNNVYASDLFYQRLNTDDNDVNFISTQSLDKVATSKINIAAPAGSLVGGITISSRARAVTRPAAYKHVFQPDGSSTAYDMSSRISLNGTTYGNKTYTTVLVNPATSLPWTLADVDEGGSFGVKSVDPD